MVCTHRACTYRDIFRAPAFKFFSVVQIMEVAGGDELEDVAIIPSWQPTVPFPFLKLNLGSLVPRSGASSPNNYWQHDASQICGPFNALYSCIRLQCPDNDPSWAFDARSDARSACRRLWMMPKREQVHDTQAW
ncbi:hypothetical protein ABZP36_020101 [Zizania latifolia]